MKSTEEIHVFEDLDINLEPSDLSETVRLKADLKDGVLIVESKLDYVNTAIGSYMGSIYYKKKSNKRFTRVGAIEYFYIFPDFAIGIQDLFQQADAICSDVFGFIDNHVEPSFYSIQMPEESDFQTMEDCNEAWEKYDERPFLKESVAPKSIQKDDSNVLPILYLASCGVTKAGSGKGLGQIALQLVMDDSSLACRLAALCPSPISVEDQTRELMSKDKLISIYQKLGFKLLAAEDGDRRSYMLCNLHDR